MADFEVMPIGTRAALDRAARMLRVHERYFNALGPVGANSMKRARREMADHAAIIASRLEALLVQPEQSNRASPHRSIES